MPANSTKPTITIGIDSSTTNCGVAVFKDGELVGTENITFDGKYNLNKLEKIINAFSEVFQKHNPDLVVLEEPAPVRHSKTLTSLNQVAGAIWAAAHMHGAYIDTIHNKTIKKYMNVKTKEDSINCVHEICGLLVASDHEADAVLTILAYEQYVIERTN
ncbi:MAG: crossover junction endodeoxyribonuclease RuvC [Patescibacteria group bacterium]|uniref:Crossover junction endodeoxyribonuclease RuvC n=1 Tax=candidate division WWE3 bacterium TaxID=2053526 RepID=A0A955EBA7_UNCKA|nr:crossover junction endodeoxyribonuclease RuvC [candidate division WWE3 bacterium]